MKKVLLNGIWKYTVGSMPETEITVPFSAHPVGMSVCKKQFSNCGGYKFAYLTFEGITYSGEVYLNGEKLGTMLPYCKYVFNVSGKLKPQNELTVILEDIRTDFGPTEGWENFGGIIRDVYINYFSGAHLENSIIKYKLNSSLTSAEISVSPDFADALGDETVVLSIFNNENLVFEKEYAFGEKITAHLENITLWELENPHLYNFTLSIMHYGEKIYASTEQIGFKTFTCDRHRFYLNGKPIFLKGVCRHEIIGEKGHTVTDAEIERDFKIIKQMGVNYVRLVHYPHSEQTIRIADKLGLLVSEEPGLWWSDTANENVKNGALEVLRRTVIRDRNKVSVAFWLCFNECAFTEEYLISAANVCRENDTTRLVSGANCMSIENTLIYYNRCKFDFYTMHPYAPDTSSMQKAVENLYDKPLLFTEWGGFFATENPGYVKRCIRYMRSCYEANTDKKALAGECFWCFAEVMDFNRGEPACINGVLKEALFDINRNKTEICDAYIKAINETVIGITPKCETYFSFNNIPFKLVENKSAAVSDAIIGRPNSPKQFEKMRWRVIKNGPVLPSEIKNVSSAPLLTANGMYAKYISDGEISSVSLLCGIFKGGYPISGNSGDTVAEITVKDTENSETYTLKNGIDVLTLHLNLGSSRINPQAQNAKPFCRFVYDANFEDYLICKTEIPLKNTYTNAEITITSKTENEYLAVYFAGK